MKRAVLLPALCAGGLFFQPSSAASTNRPCEVSHIVGGEAGYCALRVDGRVACWGDEAYYTPYAPAPAGRFVQISVGRYIFCGVREDGQGACWGKGFDQEVPEIDGEFLQLQAGGSYVAAILPDGTLDYVPLGDAEDLESPAGTFLELSNGCLRRSDDTIYCGEGIEGPSGAFERVAGLCGIAEGGQLECWDFSESFLDPEPDGLFSDVSSGDGGICAVTTDGVAMCWGPGLFPVPTPEDEFREVEFGYGWPWGLTTDGRLVPWVPYPPDELVGGSAPVVGAFAQVAAGGDGPRPYTCGVEHSGRVHCWGNTQYQAKTVPAGDFQQVGVGPYHACGLRTDSTIECWGHEDGAKETLPPDGSFSGISIGYFGPNCARRENGTIACWGYGEEALDVPAGSFASVVAGGQRACALDAQGEATCWRYVEGETINDIEMEISETPDGSFEDIATYFDLDHIRQDSHLCGLRPSGQIECWTDEEGVEAWEAPGGTFAKLSDGGGIACGIRANGHLECWGPDWLGEIDIPEGEFVTASSGAAHVCGLTSDGTVVCTGNDQTVSVCSGPVSCGNGDIDDSESCDDGDSSFAPGEACTEGCWSVPCGQPIHPGAEEPATSDALFALRAAVGTSSCSPAVCDVDASSTVTSVDALAILRRSVGLEQALSCG